ncbi:6-hydroxymethylpterin diphosphokinase MptE-like protein [Flavobacterium sp. LB3P21]|uniref:6-hydroxymethylpterin diphosphokinase MptE-like protein n=1 Tax=unclassified Flavobacterium TaxID=196869 RepID=UPI003AB02B03
MSIKKIIKPIFFFVLNIFIDKNSILDLRKNRNYLDHLWYTLRFRLAGLRIIFTKNEKKLQSFKNKHKGERCFIIGNGPSLNKLDLTLLKGETTFGVNGIYLNQEKMGFLPTYYVIEDYLIAEDRASEINELNGPVKFVPTFLDYTLKKDCNTVNFNAYINYSDKIFKPLFSDNCLRKIGVGGSVTFMCLQLAFYMGFDEVYMIGFDHNYAKLEKTDSSIVVTEENDENHFTPNYYTKGERWHDPNVDRMEKGFTVARNHFLNDNRKIWNATYKGHLEVFERKDFEKIFN